MILWATLAQPGLAHRLLLPLDIDGCSSESADAAVAKGTAALTARDSIVEDTFRL